MMRSNVKLSLLLYFISVTGNIIPFALRIALYFRLHVEAKLLSKPVPR